MTPEEFQEYLESQQDKFIQSLDPVNEKIYKIILRLIIENTKGGIFSLSDSDLANLEDEIFQAIKDSDYSKISDKYIGLFDVIEARIITEQAEINKFKASKIRDIFDGSQAKEYLADKTIKNLGSTGINQFVEQIADIVRGEAFYGKTSVEVEELIRAKIKDGEPLQKYARQVANDALNQYDGTLNNEVKQALDLTKMKYIGNLVRDSRPVCSHIMNQFNGLLEDKDITKILTDYCPNGKPSDSKITLTDIQGKEHTVKKGAGMIEGTVLTNFSVNRGGYACRHRAIWVRKF